MTYGTVVDVLVLVVVGGGEAVEGAQQRTGVGDRETGRVSEKKGGKWQCR